MSEEQKRLKHKREELAAIASAQEAGAARLTVIESELEEVTQSLKGADSSRQMSDKEVAVKEVVAELKRCYPGVFVCVCVCVQVSAVDSLLVSRIRAALVFCVHVCNGRCDST